MNDISKVVLTCPCGNELTYTAQTRKQVPPFCSDPVCTNRGKATIDQKRDGYAQTLMEMIFALQGMSANAPFEISLVFEDR